MKPNKTKTGKSTATGASSKTSATGSTPGARGAGATSKQNTKESFQKKLLICQKTYDYKDESKDVKGKTERLNAINEIQQML
jgi:hypothetical protein